MKALQLVPAMEEGGVERHVLLLDRILRDGGWENAVVSCGGRLAEELVRRGGRHLALDLKSKNPLTAPVRAWRLRRLLKRERPDVVCAHSRVPAWLFVLAARGLGVRFLTYAHGANSVSRYSRVMTRGAAVLCPSTFIRDYLHDAYGTPLARFRVIPHAVDGARFDPARVTPQELAAKRRAWGLDGARVVMSVGRISRLKGYDTLIRAFARLATDDASLRLVIVGGAEKGKEALLSGLQALAAAQGVAGRVVFAGAQADVPACLALADAVVSANTVKPESFGLSMAEALAMGRPVVAKAFGGALDIVRDGVDGVLVRGDGDPVPLFADAIARVLSRSWPDLRAGALARFDLARMSRDTLAVYAAATASKGHLRSGGNG